MKGSVIKEISNKSVLKGMLSINDIIIEVQKKSVTQSENLDKTIKGIIAKGEKTLLLTIINSQNQRRYIGVKIN